MRKSRISSHKLMIFCAAGMKERCLAVIKGLGAALYGERHKAEWRSINSWFRGEHRQWH